MSTNANNRFTHFTLSFKYSYVFQHQDTLVLYHVVVFKSYVKFVEILYAFVSIYD